MHSLQSLSLTRNEFTSFPSGLFEGLSCLETLSFYDNNLTILAPGVFNGLDNLQWLCLARNSLATIPSDLLEGLSNLRTLSLRDNVFTTLPPGLFEGLSKLEVIRGYSPRARGELNLSLHRSHTNRPSHQRRGCVFVAAKWSSCTFTSVNLIGATLSQEGLEVIVRDVAGSSANLDLSGANLAEVTDFSVLEPWPGLETLILTDANYSLSKLDAWLPQLHSLCSLTLSEDRYEASTLADLPNLSTWANQPGHQLYLVTGTSQEVDLGDEEGR